MDLEFDDSIERDTTAFDPITRRYTITLNGTPQQFAGKDPVAQLVRHMVPAPFSPLH